MGWKDNVTLMSDKPMSTDTYFPQYTTEGEVTEATAEYPTLVDPDTQLQDLPVGAKWRNLDGQIYVKNK